MNSSALSSPNLLYNMVIHPFVGTWFFLKPDSLGYFATGPQQLSFHSKKEKSKINKICIIKKPTKSATQKTEHTKGKEERKQIF